VTVGADAVLGARCLLHPGARVGERVRLGDRVIVHHNASIGADGFSFVTPEPGSIETARASGEITARNTQIVRIPSLGDVEIGDDVEIGASSAIDRAMLGTTRVGRGTKIDNQVQIGHNTVIGENCLIAGQVGISGSCRIGNRVVFAGQAGVADHATIGDDAILMAGSKIHGHVAPAAIMVGYPAVSRKEFVAQLRSISRLKWKTGDFARLEARIVEIEQRLAADREDTERGTE
jgi:UDP-3-O-[3-hydroxymyristoyl] glucosamine N-acyltransferase